MTTDRPGATDPIAGVPDELARLLERVDAIPDRSQRIRLLIDAAERLSAVPVEVAARPYPPTHRAPACVSEVYVFGESLADGTLRFHFAVENPQGIAARALAALLAETCSGAPRERVAAVPDAIVPRIFGEELSTGKQRGLAGIVAMVRGLAARE